MRARPSDFTKAGGSVAVEIHNYLDSSVRTVGGACDLLHKAMRALQRSEGDGRGDDQEALQHSIQCAGYRGPAPIPFDMGACDCNPTPFPPRRSTVRSRHRAVVRGLVRAALDRRRKDPLWLAGELRAGSRDARSAQRADGHPGGSGGHARGTAPATRGGSTARVRPDVPGLLRAGAARERAVRAVRPAPIPILPKTMTRRTRDTPGGLKTRFVKRRERHGPIRRIVGDTPMVSLYQAEVAEIERTHDELERLGILGRKESENG